MEISALARQSQILFSFSHSLAYNFDSPFVFGFIFIAGGFPSSDCALRSGVHTFRTDRFNMSRRRALTSLQQEAWSFRFVQLSLSETGLTDCRGREAKFPGKLAFLR